MIPNHKCKHWAEGKTAEDRVACPYCHIEELERELKLTQANLFNCVIVPGDEYDAMQSRLTAAEKVIEQAKGALMIWHDYEECSSALAAIAEYERGKK